MPTSPSRDPLGEVDNRCLTPAGEPRPEVDNRRLTPTGERVVMLDVLRGFALLGIFVMNVQSFSMISAAYMNPTAYGDLTGPNLWVWILSHLLTAEKMYGLFSMLFGPG